MPQQNQRFQPRAAISKQHYQTSPMHKLDYPRTPPFRFSEYYQQNVTLPYNGNSNTHFWDAARQNITYSSFSDHNLDHYGGPPQGYVPQPFQPTAAVHSAHSNATGTDVCSRCLCCPLPQAGCQGGSCSSVAPTFQPSSQTLAGTHSSYHYAQEETYRGQPVQVMQQHLGLRMDDLAHGNLPFDNAPLQAYALGQASADTSQRGVPGQTPPPQARFYLHSHETPSSQNVGFLAQSLGQHSKTDLAFQQSVVSQRHMKAHDSSVHCQRSGWQPVPAGRYNGYTLGVSQGISLQMPISSAPAQHARPSAAKLQHTCLPERPANNLHNPQHPRPQAGRTSRSSHAKSLRRKPKGEPEKAWTEAGSERKDSWGRFDLKIDEIEEGKIVFLVPNGDWTTAHPALVLGCDDKENVHVLQCTSFGKSTSIHSRFGNLEQPERDLNKSDYLLIADRPLSKGPKPHLGLPVLRLRDKWPLAKATYVWFEFPRSFKLSQLRHYADGLSIDHTFVLNGASKRIVRAQLERRLQRMYHNLSVKREELAGKGKPLEQSRAAEDKMAEIERTHLTKVLRRRAEQVAKMAKERGVNRMSGVESGKIQSRGATKTRARKLMRPKKQSRKPSDQI